MTSSVSKLMVFVVLAFAGATAVAQGVYMTPGKSGPVFSDKPQAGAREVTLKPLNVVPPVEAPPALPVTKEAKTGRLPEEAPAPSYRSLAIVSPENNGSVAGNSSLFEVRLFADPPLSVGEGHVFLVRINGRTVERRFSAPEFVIPPEFWEYGYVPADQSMQIEASIADGAGQILMRAAPVVVYTRQIYVRPNGVPILPGYRPPPVRPPKPRPKPEMPTHSVEVPTSAIKR